jgi:SAM-dependent methyltransferase
MDYTPMAGHYDKIMLSGYYDYPAIADHVAAVPGVRRVLEVGVGTGLVVEHLLQRRADYEAVAGIDITPGMLEIARRRLRPYPQVQLDQRDVIQLGADGSAYDLAYSYGGVWYFVPDGDSWMMVSHIRGDDANAVGLERVAACLVPGGRLLLGVQQPHSAYSRGLGDGTTYTQRLYPLEGGFRKEYLLTRDGAEGEPLVYQVTDYRTYPYEESLGLLAACGLKPADAGDRHGPMFLEFTRP